MTLISTLAGEFSKSTVFLNETSTRELVSSSWGDRKCLSKSVLGPGVEGIHWQGGIGDSNNFVFVYLS